MVFLEDFLKNFVIVFIFTTCFMSTVAYCFCSRNKRIRIRIAVSVEIAVFSVNNMIVPYQSA